MIMHNPWVKKIYSFLSVIINNQVMMNNMIITGTVRQCVVVKQDDFESQFCLHNQPHFI